MSNKQVIALFIVGIALLLGAFWAGLNVVKEAPSTASEPVAADSKNASSGKQPPAGTQTQTQEESKDARFIVQVGAYGTKDQADHRVSELRQKYLSAHTQEPNGPDTLYRVRIGPYKTREEAQQVASELTTEGMKGVMIIPGAQN